MNTLEDILIEFHFNRNLIENTELSVTVWRCIDLPLQNEQDVSKITYIFLRKESLAVVYALVYKVFIT